jgi:LacI family gluconate utilization system Gnt-I transcriptional repressor
MAQGISVPQDLALAGFNGLDLGQTLPVPLTTTATHRTRIGEVAASAILDRLEGRQTARLTDVGYTLIKGGTA